MMDLNATKVKNAKPAETSYKLFDGGGFYLLVYSSGSKSWRLKYRFWGKEKLPALGTYPPVQIQCIDR